MTTRMKVVLGIVAVGLVAGGVIALAQGMRNGVVAGTQTVSGTCLRSQATSGAEGTTGACTGVCLQTQNGAGARGRDGCGASGAGSACPQMGSAAAQGRGYGQMMSQASGNSSGCRGQAATSGSGSCR
jgi:hypothetical protein